MIEGMAPLDKTMIPAGAALSANVGPARGAGDEATLLQVVSEPRKLRETIPQTISHCRKVVRPHNETRCRALSCNIGTAGFAPATP